MDALPSIGFIERPPAGATVCAAHQPNLLPWAGYLAKMHRADVFVIADTVQYVKQNFISRCKIVDRNGPHWLSIPVLHKGRFGQTEREVRIDYTAAWERKFRRSLEHRYGGSPLFTTVGKRIIEEIEMRHDLLIDLNLALLRLLAETLGITTPLMLLSETGVTATGRCERIAAMTIATGSTHYLSGKGASLRYLTDDVFKNAGISWSFFSYSEPPYQQPSPDFVPGTSVIDSLFRLGRDETRRRIGIS